MADQARRGVLSGSQGEAAEPDLRSAVDCGADSQRHEAGRADQGARPGTIKTQPQGGHGRKTLRGQLGEAGREVQDRKAEAGYFEAVGGRAARGAAGADRSAQGAVEVEETAGERVDDSGRAGRPGSGNDVA